ncbi:MAG: hypothetical protein N2F24_00345, partial [Deltaproteobacteria bacterium]
NARLGRLMEHKHDELNAFAVADQELNAKTETLSKQVGEMADAYSSFSEKLTEFQKALSDVSTTKIDKNELDLALKLKEIGFRQEILDATSTLGKKINALQNQIDHLKKTRVTTTAAQPEPAPTENKPEAAQPNAEQAPGSIEEQNIE